MDGFFFLKFPLRYENWSLDLFLMSLGQPS